MQLNEEHQQHELNYGMYFAHDNLTLLTTNRIKGNKSIVVWQK